MTTKTATKDENCFDSMQEMNYILLTSESVVQLRLRWVNLNTKLRIMGTFYSLGPAKDTQIVFVDMNKCEYKGSFVADIANF